MLHLAVDADNGEILAHSLTDQDDDDASQLEQLLDQIDNDVDQSIVGGAYDGALTCDAVLRYSEDARVFVPTRSSTAEPPKAQDSCQRQDHRASMPIFAL